MIPWLGPSHTFPAPESALREPNGLLAAGGDLSPERLLAAYRLGIFPWFAEGEPILWWSPAPRMVLLPGQLKVSRSLAKTLRNSRYEIRVDSAFAEVMRQCAAPRDGRPGTWITRDMQQAYVRLHRQGHAHSFETWVDGQLVGGLYGVSIGSVFYGESMFARQRDASKLAFVHMVRQLQQAGVGMIDCQMHTDHLASLGAATIEREAFQQQLNALCERPLQGQLWNYHYSTNEPTATN